VAQKIYKDMPQAFIGAALGALAEMTMEFMVREPILFASIMSSYSAILFSRHGLRNVVEL